MSDYQVRVELGSQWWTTITAGTAQSWTGPVVLDGLGMGWAWESDEGPGAQLEALQATLRIAVRDVAAVGMRNVQQGQAGAVYLLDSTGAVQGSVGGQIVELTAEQLRRRDPDGVVRVWTVYTVQLVSWDAVDTETITALLDQAPPLFRWDQIKDLADAPLQDPQVSDSLTDQTLIAEQLNEARLVDVLRDHLRSVLSGPSTPRYPSGAQIPSGRFSVLAALWGGQLEAPYMPDGYLHRYAPLWVRDVLHTELPMRYGKSGQLLTILPVTAGSSAGAIPASQVELGGSWRQGPEGAAEAVTVRVPSSPASGAGGSISGLAEYAVTEYAPGKTKRTARNRREVPGKLAEAAQSRTLARALMPEPVPGRWDRDTFVWRAPSVDALGGRFFPHFHSDDYGGEVLDTPYPEAQYPVPPCLVAPVVVYGIPTSSNLGGSPAGLYAGQLRSVQLQLAGGDLVVTFSLRRSLPRSSWDPTNTSQRLTYANARAIAAFVAPVVTYRGPADRVDPAVTFRDLRLTRRNVL